MNVVQPTLPKILLYAVRTQLQPHRRQQPSEYLIIINGFNSFGTSTQPVIFQNQLHDIHNYVIKIIDIIEY